jgi:hypothetical protein
LEAWLGLPLDQTISSATILRHVSAWPADELIEVRSCRECGRAIARKVQRGPRSVTAPSGA